MKRQYLREHHNRQEKVWKEKGTGGYYGGSPGGVPRAWERVPNVDWSTEPPKFYWTYRHNAFVDRCETKLAMAQSFIEQLSSTRLRIHGYKFNLAWDVKTFARANDLPINSAKTKFAKLATQVRHRLETIRQRFYKAPLRLSLKQSPDGSEYIKTARIHVKWQDLLTPD